MHNLKNCEKGNFFKGQVEEEEMMGWRQLKRNGKKEHIEPEQTQDEENKTANGDTGEKFLWSFHREI